MSIVSEVRERLATMSPALLCSVEGAAGLQAAMKQTPPALPAAFVVSPEDAASPNERQTGPALQMVQVDITVLTCVSNVTDATGAAAAADEEVLKRAIRARLLGWQPPTAFDPIEMIGSRLIAGREGTLWLEQTFGTAELVEQET